MATNFVNADYEFIIREYPTAIGERAPNHETLEKSGFRMVWASVTIGGTFAVYSRYKQPI